MRLQKYLAECGVASRRAAERYVKAGRVTVNGEVAIVGRNVDPDKDSVSLDGATVERDEKVYIVLHKPPGVITTAKDTFNRPTVLDCVEDIKSRLFPVGRLDMDATGTLLLTNDGELAYRLTHPSYQVDKVYHAWVEGVMTEETAQTLAKGVELEDGPTAPATSAIIKSFADSTLVRLVIHEGRNRLVKRMCAAVGHPVRDLRRISVGTIAHKGLHPGEWRYLSNEEVTGLKKLTGLAETIAKT